MTSSTRYAWEAPDHEAPAPRDQIPEPRRPELVEPGHPIAAAAIPAKDAER
jgi:hypothetical protein